eukprot:Gregarina_sp_Poly_1__10930@NODE_858_length_5948_cov_134_133141_g620_i0_p1_GENE_NODE_858_length_5948_cov_134_133141_g620_i0NODE_858_length_5948_cov_134_133141_g620_i0_p1_ORF_typecomplete_len1265_score160_06UCH/PF00443_29/2_5e57UCH_1/PF13423_6/6_8e05UCH_1/PF13423_6/2_7e03UCH_1/PF13423_6/9_5e09zfMYND/PF01753_18/1_2e07zfMYND/PF01753_18/4_2e03zfMYND/PF01753_18/1_8e04zfMYND/PF01753_18/8_1e03zfMYND/PF01753_18/1_2e03Peptidase_C98/PF15499_6/9e02Peptidase_C98/PF15499_6/9_3Peptidase_C98/PF15499_6/7_4e02Pep
MPSEFPFCWNCGSRATNRCKTCGAAMYCDSQCQRSNWASHRKICGGWKNNNKAGIPNIGNSCWLATSLQLLNAIVPFRNYFVSALFKSHLKSSGNGIAIPYSELAIQLQTKPILSTESFKREIDRLTRNFPRDEQQDAQEFLSWLLDQLHEETNVASGADQILGEPGISKNTLVESNHIRSYFASVAQQEELRASSYIHRLFSGWFFSSLQCSACGFNSRKFDKTLLLSLPLPPADLRPVRVVFFPADFGTPLAAFMHVSASWTCRQLQTRLSERFQCPELSLAVGVASPRDGVSIERFLHGGPKTLAAVLEVDAEMKRVLWPSMEAGSTYMWNKWDRYETESEPLFLPPELTTLLVYELRFPRIYAEPQSRSHPTQPLLPMPHAFDSQSGSFRRGPDLPDCVVVPAMAQLIAMQFVPHWHPEDRVTPYTLEPMPRFPTPSNFQDYPRGMIRLHPPVCRLREEHELKGRLSREAACEDIFQYNNVVWKDPIDIRGSGTPLIGGPPAGNYNTLQLALPPLPRTLASPASYPLVVAVPRLTTRTELRNLVAYILSRSRRQSFVDKIFGNVGVISNMRAAFELLSNHLREHPFFCKILHEDNGDERRRRAVHETLKDTVEEDEIFLHEFVRLRLRVLAAEANLEAKHKRIGSAAESFVSVMESEVDYTSKEIKENIQENDRERFECRDKEQVVGESNEIQKEGTIIPKENSGTHKESSDVHEESSSIQEESSGTQVTITERPIQPDFQVPQTETSGIRVIASSGQVESDDTHDMIEGVIKANVDSDQCDVSSPSPAKTFRSLSSSSPLESWVEVAPVVETISPIETLSPVDTPQEGGASAESARLVSSVDSTVAEEPENLALPKPSHHRDYKIEGDPEIVRFETYWTLPGGLECYLCPYKRPCTGCPQFGLKGELTCFRDRCAWESAEVHDGDTPFMKPVVQAFTDTMSKQTVLTTKRELELRGVYAEPPFIVGTNSIDTHNTTSSTHCDSQLHTKFWEFQIFRETSLAAFMSPLTLRVDILLERPISDVMHECVTPDSDKGRPVPTKLPCVVQMQKQGLEGMTERVAILKQLIPYQLSAPNIAQLVIDTRRYREAINVRSAAVSLESILYWTYNESHTDWKCDKCGKSTNNRKIDRIWDLGPVVLLQMNRFHHTMESVSKNNVRVRCDLGPKDLSGFTMCGKKSQSYELVGVINHMGIEGHAGHYIAVCKNNHNTWIAFDDDVMFPITGDAVAAYLEGDRSNCYILAYCSTDRSIYPAPNRNLSIK